MASKAMSIQFLLAQVRDISGPLFGGSATFYDAGTEDLKTVWLDRDKVSEASNPFDLDSNATAQLYGDGLYKIIIKNASDVPVYTRDYIQIVDFLSSGFELPSSDFDSLNDAITQIGSTPATLNIFTPDFPMTGIATAPSTLAIKFTYPGSLKNDYAVTFNGPFSAGDYQVFTGSGTVTGIADVIPEWWGAGDESDVADSTTAMQAAIDSVLSNPRGGVIRLGSVIYAITNLTIVPQNVDKTCYLTFQGLGIGTSYFRINATSGNVFDMTDARYIIFADFSTTHHTASATTEILFKLDASSNITFNNLRLNGGYTGFDLAGNSTSVITLDNVWGLDYSTHSWEWFFKMTGVNSSILIKDTVFATATSPSGGGFLIDGANDTFDMTGGGVQKQGSAQIPYGLRITTNAGEFISVLDSKFECGSTSGIGVSVEGGSNVQFKGVHAVTGKNGFVVSGGSAISILGGRIYHNGREGLKITGGTDINVDSVAIHDNGFETTNTYDQVSVAANVSGFSIVNNNIGKHRVDALYPRYGIYIATGKSDNYTILGNIITDTGTGDIFDGGQVGAGFGITKNISNPNDTEGSLPIHSHVRTTDATVTSLWSKTVPDNTAIYLTAKVIFQGSAGAGATSAYTRSVLVYRDGAGAVIIGSVVAPETIEYFAGDDCTWDVSGNDVRLRVTGTIGGTYDWYANVQIMPILDATAHGVLP